MKTPLLSILLLSMTVFNSGYGQAILPPTVLPSCRHLFENCARALPGLYDAQNWDAIAALVRLRRERCGYQPDVLALATLLQIQQGTFTPDSLDIRQMYRWLDDYAHIIAPYIKGESFFNYFSAKGYNPTKFDRMIFSTTTEWSRRLLGTRRLDSLQTFLCKVFSGEISDPRRTVLNDTSRYLQLDSMINRSWEVLRNSRRFDMSGGFGIWMPNGNLSILGPKVDFVPLELGGRGRLNEVDLNFTLRFGQATQPYTVIRQFQPYTTNFYTGLFVGLTYTHYVVHRTRWETGFLAGIGFDGLDFSANPNSSSGMDLSPITLGSLNTHIGWRYNYFFTPYVFMGLALRWNFVDYPTDGGSSLYGNAVSIDLLIGGNW
jgi:hypothetical protein